MRERVDNCLGFFGGVIEFWDGVEESWALTRRNEVFDTR